MLEGEHPFPMIVRGGADGLEVCFVFEDGVEVEVEAAADDFFHAAEGDGGGGGEAGCRGQSGLGSVKKEPRGS